MYFNVYILIMCYSILYTAPALAHCILDESSKVHPSDGDAGDYFGHSISLSGNTAIIGAYRDDQNGTRSGSAYIYQYNGTTWNKQYKLLASDGTSYDYFGCSVAISGDVLIIGSFRDNDNGYESGSAYIYRYNGETWIEEAKLLASDGAAGDEFGCAVSINGQFAIVGAYKKDGTGENSGAAYLFDVETGEQVFKITADDATPGDGFGECVSISERIAVIGAPYKDDIGNASGAAYLFDVITGLQLQKLMASDASSDHYFGSSVSISGDVAIIGADGDSDNGLYAGAAYVFRNNSTNWIEEQKLYASDGDEGDKLGHSIGSEDDIAIIGAHHDDDNGYRSGSAYIYRYNGETWIEEAKLLASDGAEEDAFGNSISISNDLSIIGAHGDDDNGSLAGAVYTYNQITADCNDNGVIDGCDIYYGTSLDHNSNGVPDECDCNADLNGDETVNINDIFMVLGLWGECDLPCPPYCFGEITYDCTVNIDDIFAILGQWGDCE